MSETRGASQSEQLPQQDRAAQAKVGNALAIVAGILGAAVGAALWFLVAVATGWRVSWMAIAVGLLVGLPMRLLAKRADSTLAGLAAIFALVGCVAGNTLMFCNIAAQQTNLTLSYVLGDLDPMVAVEMFQQGFRPLDVAFYAIGVIGAFLLTLRRG